MSPVEKLLCIACGATGERACLHTQPHKLGRKGGQRGKGGGSAIYQGFAPEAELLGLPDREKKNTGGKGKKKQSSFGRDARKKGTFTNKAHKKGHSVTGHYHVVFKISKRTGREKDSEQEKRRKNDE